MKFSGSRTPYTAVKRISKATGKGKGKILSAVEMDRLYPEKKEEGAYWEKNHLTLLHFL